MPFTDVAKAFIELGFPVAVAVYLLVYQGNKIEALIRKQTEVEIGLRLILSKLEATDEYHVAVSEFRKRESDGV